MPLSNSRKRPVDEPVVRGPWIPALCLAFWLGAVTSPGAAEFVEADLCVYGGASGGVVAAVQAARLGKSVLLLAQDNHLGGMSSGGLGVTDRGQIGSIGGVSREFYRRVGQRYGVSERFDFEPHVAEEVFWQMAREAGVMVFTNQRFAAVTMDGLRLVELRAEDGSVFRARMFIDATYEGDLMALAGVTFTVGREGTDAYGESLAGVRAPSGGYDYDPFVVAGDPASGRLPFLEAEPPGPVGSGDHRVQAYNFRLCLTQNATNRLPITPPAGYSEARYELVARYLEARLARDGAVSLGQLIHLQTQIPNGKTDINANGELSTDFVNESWTWATNTHAGREVIRQTHEDYIRGLLHFYASSSRVPAGLRAEMQAWGLCRDEFQDTGGWPHQLYVREARRMVGDYVMRQQNCSGQEFAPESVGLASYAMDSHAVTRMPSGGLARSEGGFFVSVPQPFPISYRSIVPRVGECENLFSTFALSASHVAFASCRMEPVFMILSQSAATAAALALDDNVAAQAVSYPKLATQLLADGQLLDWVGGTLSPNGVILDNAQPGVAITGSWANGANPGYWGTGYLHDQNSGKGSKWVRFTPNLPFSGAYEVFTWYVADPNRATNVPYDIVHPAGTNRVLLNQRLNGSQWVFLLRTNFSAGQGGGVILRNDNTDGFVIADAVRFLPVGAFTVPPPTVSLLASDPLAGEYRTNVGRFTVVRSGDTSQALTVSYEVTGTARNGADYAALGGVVTIPAGSNAAAIFVVPRPDPVPEGEETVTLTLVPGAAYGLSALSNATVVIADQPFDAWRLRHFSPPELADPAQSGPDADPDGDGVLNLQEYALGLDPRTANVGANGLPRAEIRDGWFTFSYSRLKAATDVAILIERSGNLSEWNPGPACLETVSVTDQGTTQLVTVRDTTPVSASGAAFLRLRLLPVP